MKTLITNVAYGPTYAKIFCEYHLRSLLDPTNIPAHKDSILYTLLTDEETFPLIKDHPNFKTLCSLINVGVKKINWPEASPDDRYPLRYGALQLSLREALLEALEKDALVMASCADLYYAKNFFDKTRSILEKGYGGVMIQPPRTCIETIPLGTYVPPGEGTLEAKDLFELAYANLHPLWFACHFESPNFTRIPDTLLWNTGTGILGRSFSMSFVTFRPHKKMLDVGGTMDGEIGEFIENPYYCRNWDEAPLIGVEPLLAFYPPFTQAPADCEKIAERVRTQHRLNCGKHKIYYPNEKTVGNTADQDSDCALEKIAIYFRMNKK